jgi:4-amino-4-deoxy-L-arabinose transferase-like glycosyltransferase
MFNIELILKKIKHNINTVDLIALVGILGIYLITRLFALNNFPIFVDEGIYIHWAKIARADASWRFISLTDGKQPLHTWGIIPFLKLFPNDALLAGRLFSVCSGLVALGGMFFLLYYLFGKKAAILGVFIYVLTPFFLFYDRLALADSAVNAGFIWMLFFSILLIKTLRLDVALIFGLISGLALLIKSSSWLFLGLAALAPILAWKKKINRFFHTWLNYYILYGLTFVLAFVIYNVQRLSPFLHYVAEKNKTFVMTFSEFIRNPFFSFFVNIKNLPIYILLESGIVIFILGLIGFYLIFQKHWRLATYLSAWFLIPFMMIAFFSKVIFPRYLIFFASLLVITTTYLFVYLKKHRLLSSSILGIVLLINGYFNYTILIDYRHLPFPEVDRGQYITGITAGWGVKEIMEIARQLSQKKPVLLLAEGNFGLIADMLYVYKQPNDPIEIRAFWPLNKQDLIANQSELKNKIVLVVFSHRQQFSSDWPIKLIKKYPKPNSNLSYHLFLLKPN